MRAQGKSGTPVTEGSAGLLPRRPGQGETITRLGSPRRASWKVNLSAPHHPAQQAGRPLTAPCCVSGPILPPGHPSSAASAPLSCSGPPPPPPPPVPPPPTGATPPPPPPLPAGGAQGTSHDESSVSCLAAALAGAKLRRVQRVSVPRGKVTVCPCPPRQPPTRLGHPAVSKGTPGCSRRESLSQLLLRGRLGKHFVNDGALLT